jgi:hypothetical protein
MDRYAWLSRRNQFMGYAASALQDEFGPRFAGLKGPIPIRHPEQALLQGVQALFPPAGR